MVKRTFKRGVRPPHLKYTSNEPAREIAPKEGCVFIFPMLQHIGAPCEPTVAVGDAVLAGQKIGESNKFVSAPIHSSVSGTVVEIRPALTPSGVTVNSVFVENDGRYEKHPSLTKSANHKNISKSEIIGSIREAGIVGLGGAGFPTHVKLSPPEEKIIDIIIVNASECEPYITTDHRALLDETDELLGGLQIILSLFGGARGIIAVETNKQDAIDKLFNENKSANVEIIPLAPKFPQGSERQLIKTCAGREVPSGGLPADIGCIVQNASTVVSVFRAVTQSVPLIQKTITVAGGAVKNPGNYKIPIGMKYRDLIDAIGGFITEPRKMISGGPMTGVAMFTVNVPFIKTSSCFLALTENECETPQERNCFRCGKCLAHCPTGLMPNELNKRAVHSLPDEFEKYNGAECVECGSCSYVCPAKRHLAQSIRVMKRAVIGEKMKREAASG